MSDDFLIIGAGSAGGVLAHRLSADPGNRVTLLEAGPPDRRWDFRLHMPAALAWPLQGRTYNWWYESDPEPHMNGRRIYHPRGKVLGGSSSINGMIYIRGNPLDYARWSADPALADWDYAHVLPYFKRAETRAKGGDAWRGDSGPVTTTTGACDNPLFAAFFAACEEAGHPLSDDVNGYRQEGFGPFDMTVRRGLRCNTSRGYLDPARGRPNLRVLTGAFVEQLRFEGQRAIGARVSSGGKSENIDAAEVIVCAGAINSPQLLQLAGIGDAERLEALGISVRQHLPGVGENLQDHLEVYVQQACTQPVSLYDSLKWWKQAKIGLEWQLRRTGLGASNQFEGGGFIRSNEEVAYPNLQYHFLPIAIKYDGTAPKDTHGYQAHVGPMNSDARGHVRVRSTDPRQHPSILFNYLSTDKDRREWVEAIRKTREIFAQSAFDDYRGEELQPGGDAQSDEAILAFVRSHGESAYHPSCTCAMGSGEQAVVDGEGRVHGLQNLRVVDASIMPSITNGNLNAPTIMIAEKIADRILGNSPLAPQSVPWYRHGRGDPLQPPGAEAC